MGRLVPLVIRPWMLPLIVAALVLPIIGGFLLAGPPLGLAVGALAVASLLVVAARAQYDEPIEVQPSGDRRYRLLVVAAEPVEPETVERIAEIASEGRALLDRGEPAELLVLAPAHLGLLDRWASDLGAARDAAARALAVSIAALAAAGLTPPGTSATPTRCRRSRTSSPASRPGRWSSSPAPRSARSRRARSGVGSIARSGC